MEKKNALTLVEVLVIIVVIVCTVLFSIHMSNLNHSRKRGLGRRAVCLSNLKDLALAWVMYADDNDGDLVNGMAGIDRVDNSTSPPTILERAWIGPIPLNNGNPTIDIRTQEKRIQEGALWEYVRNPKVFRCPAGKVNHLVTYQIVDSMNGFQQPDTVAERVWASKRGELSRPGNKIVFIDIGEVRSSSYHVSYREAKWLDMPPLRHHQGVTVGFADAHAEYWKWKGKETIKLGESAGPTQISQHVEPKTVEGKEDLQKMQRAVWGELGYTPSVGE